MYESADDFALEQSGLFPSFNSMNEQHLPSMGRQIMCDDGERSQKSVTVEDDIGFLPENRPSKTEQHAQLATPTGQETHARSYFLLVLAVVPKDQNRGARDECVAQLPKTLHYSFVETLYPSNTRVNA